MIEKTFEMEAEGREFSKQNTISVDIQKDQQPPRRYILLNLILRHLIKSGYYIIPNPFTTLTLGMSPLYSRSPSSSPSRSGSPVPSYHASYLSSAGSSPISDPEDRYLHTQLYI